jgi:uncharacterized damage-inducible protein DinB
MYEGAYSRRGRPPEVDWARWKRRLSVRFPCAHMHQTQRIADAYHAATVKAAWYGPSLAELLVQVSPELATTSLPGSHSISELLQHLLLWNERVCNTFDGNSLPRWQPEKDWAEAPIPWNELVSRWRQSRELLEDKIRNFPIEDLAKQVPGRNYPYETMLHGIVEHTIYHAGQIAMALSILPRELRRR